MSISQLPTACVCWQAAFRVLEPGGRLRTCLPDFEKLACAYVNRDESYFAPLYDVYGELIGDRVPGSASVTAAVNNGLYQFGQHRCMYDREKLTRLSTGLGFSRVEASTFDESIDIDPDIYSRFSLYLDAFK